MDFNEYSEAAGRTARFPETPDEWRHDLMLFGLGAAGEAGEIADVIKKLFGHGHDADECREKLEKEIGDELWYLDRIASLIGTTLEQCAIGNVQKLNRRYPNGFSHEASRARVDVPSGPVPAELGLSSTPAPDPPCPGCGQTLWGTFCLNTVCGTVRVPEADERPAPEPEPAARNPNHTVLECPGCGEPAYYRPVARQFYCGTIGCRTSYFEAGQPA